MPPSPATATAGAGGQSPTTPIWAQAAKRKPSSEYTRSSVSGDAKRRTFETGSGAGVKVDDVLGGESGADQQGKASPAAVVGVGRASEPRITPGAREDVWSGLGGEGALHPSSPMNPAAAGRGSGRGRGGAENVEDPYKDPRRQRRGG